MKFFRNPLGDDKLVLKIEVSLLRAYLIFDIAYRLMILGIDQAREAVQHLGLR